MCCIHILKPTCIGACKLSLHTLSAYRYTTQSKALNYVHFFACHIQVMSFKCRCIHILYSTFTVLLIDNSGTKQSGEVLNDIVLPPWAKGDPQEFIRLHREVGIMNVQ